jgi:hypothetical protein
MKFIELWRCLKEAIIERVIEAWRLVILVRNVSKSQVDHGMPPSPWIPQNPCVANDNLKAMGTILERLREDYASGHGPWD